MNNFLSADDQIIMQNFGGDDKEQVNNECFWAQEKGWDCLFKMAQFLSTQLPRHSAPTTPQSDGRGWLLIKSTVLIPTPITAY